MKVWSACQWEKPEGMPQLGWEARQLGFLYVWLAGLIQLLIFQSHYHTKVNIFWFPRAMQIVLDFNTLWQNMSIAEWKMCMLTCGIRWIRELADFPGSNILKVQVLRWMQIPVAKGFWTSSFCFVTKWMVKTEWWELCRSWNSHATEWLFMKHFKSRSETLWVISSQGLITLPIGGVWDTIVESFISAVWGRLDVNQRL